MTPVAITDFTAASALGTGRDAHRAALADGRSGLVRRDFETATLGAFTGIVDGLDDAAPPPGFEAFDCRNNRLAERALRADDFYAAVRRARSRHGPRRIGVFVGTSTSGILQTELAYRERDAATGALPGWLDYGRTHNTFSAARYLREVLDLAGPAFVVSTACSSSAKVFANAARMLSLGWVDAAIVGGVDSLCMTTLYGFRSLELVSGDVCRPWDAARDGLSLGEAAAFALLERADDAGDRTRARLLGTGESSDGHHMSAPHPEGAGAQAAMRQALAAAGLQPQDVDYLNLHGTATPGNDAAEDRAVAAVFGTDGRTACSSTKGFTGHTLGAAGGVEAVLALLAMERGEAPPTLNLRDPDPALAVPVLREPRRRPMRVVASNSFGFGGSNACLVFGSVR